MPKRKRDEDSSVPSHSKGESEKREEYISKPVYYMGIALLAAERSKDPSTRVGACIINQEERIVGIGYNGMPQERHSTFPWNQDKTLHLKEQKYAYVCHAILNAIVNKNAFDVRGCTIYTKLFPCNECAKLIVQAGISKVIYLSDEYYTREGNENKEAVDASKIMLDIAGVKYLKFDLLSNLSGREKIIEIELEQGNKMSPDHAEAKKMQKTDNMSEPREDNLDESDYFMAIALLSAKRSKDKATQVGACIISEDKKVVGIGYNGMPNCCSDDIMPWGKREEFIENKHAYVCHAELNAIMNKNCFDVKGCSMYVTLFPCNQCAKLLIQSGIKEVVYLDDRPDKPEMQASREMLKECEVNCQPFRENDKARKNVVLNFSEEKNTISSSE